MCAKGVSRALHYLDDYMFFGGLRFGSAKWPSTQASRHALSSVGRHTRWRVPVPVWFSLIGIEIDLVASQLRLPHDKLSVLKVELG